MMHWKTVTPAQSQAFLRKGTELAFAVVPNCGHRFVICEVRRVERNECDLEYDREYWVRDADTVSDADVRNRVRPHVVAKFSDEQSALAFCLEQMETEP